MLALAAAVPAAFFSILRAFHTADLGVNPLSVATSFPAVYLAFRRNPHCALAYAANGLVPIALLALGYPAENARPSRLHTERKPLEEMVRYR